MAAAEGFAQAPIPAGLDGGAGAQQQESSHSGSLDRMRALLSQFYGMEGDADPHQKARQERDIDSSAFAVDKYTASLLREQPLPELLRRDDKPVDILLLRTVMV